MARPGDTLCLLDGKYTDSASMIIPPKNLSGRASAPITVRALNDGKVTVNGQRSRPPVALSYNNNYFVLEGFNAHSSNGSVVSLSRSNHNVVRRVAAWDAADNNTSIFGISYGSHNLLEDVAGWGVARKTFSASQGGNYTTIRRAWGRWEGSHVVGPKMTYSLAYNNYNMTCENCIGTWSGERMKKSYTLLDYYGKPWTGNAAGVYSNYSVNQAYGIFAIDGLSGNKNAHTKLLGSLAYIRAADRFAASRAIFVSKVDSLEITDTVVYVQSGANTNKQRFSLNNLTGGTAVKLIARKLTGIGGTASYYGSHWKRSLISEGSSLSSVGGIYTSTAGANLCKRYENRKLTSKALWPWPMNQRIISAMVESGRSAVDVTKTIQAMLGPIPSACRATSGADTSISSTTIAVEAVAPPIPSSPVDLKAEP